MITVIILANTSLTDNLAEGLHKGKCKNCKSSLEYITGKDGLETTKRMRKI